MDGMEPCDKRVLDVLAVMGVYQDNIMCLSAPPWKMVLGLAPVQLMLCLKTQNAGKINSYRWIYNAFGRILNPEIVVNGSIETIVRDIHLEALNAKFEETFRRALEPDTRGREPETGDLMGEFMGFRTMLRYDFGDPHWKEVWFFRV
ncbi:hypothetical protein B0T25DRAFT_578343 [Lasiosphaeria hispida]|uniref:Chitin synthase n=1 Tax=Lasiosphaeria hispida TaxID=260671 RepID=A0AAJ0MIP0_9PEZI|nr:hypothetical protein B0T25DRAFT_578343 [Lasiosphaeria hispida]